ARPAGGRRRRRSDHGKRSHRRDASDLPPHQVEDQPVRPAAGLRGHASGSSAARRRHHPGARGGCPRTLLTASSGGRAFQIALTGEAESPAGDPVATGTATVRLRAGQGQVCYRLAVRDLPPAVAAHIHQGRAGASGNVVVPLKTPSAAGASSGCAAAPRTLVQSILRSPAGFYVNVHTGQFPNGAVRGQLTGTSTAAFG